MWTLSKELEKHLDGTYTSEITCSCTGSESLLEEPSNKGRNLRRTSIYLQNRGSEKSKIRRPLLPCQRPGDLRSTTMETTLSKEGEQTSHLS